MSYYMSNSAILPEYRRKGYYSLLARGIVEEVTRRGYHKIKSRHYPTNNAVIIAKLKLGFVITGFQLSANFGTLVELEWNAKKEIQELMHFRCGAQLPSDSSLQAIGLKRNN
jgi:L-amino acid N-acyltransferase YncA